MSRSARMAAPFLAALIAVAGLGAADGGYFPSDWGLATLGFTLIAVTLVLVTDAPRPSGLELAFLGGLTLFAGWAALSSFWSPGAAAPVLEAERGILYVAATAAALLLLSTREASAGLLGGIVAGAVLVSLYALGTRLFPGHVGGAYDPSSGYQLAEPIGYWNALGLLAAIAILLALGFAAHGHRRDAGARRRSRSSSSCPRSTSRSAGARSWRSPAARWCRSCSTRAAPGSSSRGSWSPCRPRSGCSRPRSRTHSPRPARRCRRHRPRAATSHGGSSCLRSSRPRRRSSCSSSSGGYGCRSGQAPSSSPRPCGRWARARPVRSSQREGRSPW